VVHRGLCRGVMKGLKEALSLTYIRKRMLLADDKEKPFEERILCFVAFIVLGSIEKSNKKTSHTYFNKYGRSK